MENTPECITLRDLPLAARILLSAFLISVGIGYLSALVQLHFQHASSGEPLPKPDDVVTVYHGGMQASEMERILTADESRPFSSGGTMRPAFFAKAAGWKVRIRRRAKEDKISEVEAEKVLRREREGELNALLEWIRAGAKKETYTAFPVSQEFVKSAYGDRDPEETFFQKDDKEQWTAIISNIVDQRCVRCHQEGKNAGQIDLSEWEDVRTYCDPGHGAGLSLTKLAQSTHVHLLGFSMLYGLTGLIYAFTSHPGLLRCLLAPLPLIAQVVDIACWWLARVDPMFAKMIVVTGGIVACSLVLQIVLSLFNMYRPAGKVVVLLLLVLGGVGSWQVMDRVVEPYLAKEKAELSTR